MNKTNFLFQALSRAVTNIEHQTKSCKILIRNIDIDIIKTLMETQASIFDKILNTTSVFSKNILHPEPGYNFSFTKENDELNDQCNQTSNNKQKKRLFIR